MLLYVVSTVFISYLIFQQMDSLSTWMAIFWIILLFASTNASINSFKNETGRQFFYYYSTVKPEAIILSKIIFNSLLMLLVALTNLAFYSLLLGNPVEEMGIFSLVLIFGVFGFAGILTLVSAIASKTNNNSTLTALLGFPIMLPLILSAIKASMLCGLGFGWEDCRLYIGLLALINVIIIALSYILFPYLWRS